MPSERANDEAALKQLYADLYRGMLKKDKTTLDRVLAPDFVLIHMTGMHQPKSAFITAVLDGTLNYYAEQSEDVRVIITDESATVYGQSRVTAAVFGGGRHTWRLEQDLTCEKTDGKWRITKSKASTY